MALPATARGPQSTTAPLLGHRPGAPTMAPAAARAWRAGLAAFARNDLRAALRALREAALQAPRDAEIHATLGVVQLKAGDRTGALDALRRATELVPDSPAAWRLLADTALTTGANVAALEALRQLVRLVPDDAEALGNLGALYREAGEPETALRALHRSLALDPENPRTLSNTALAFHDVGEFAMARTAAEAAVTRKTDYENARWNLALMDLLHGDFARGWSGHERRESVRVLEATTRRYDQPRWDGGPVEGTLLLWPEQGLGDQLQFVRFVPEAARRAGPGARVVLATPAPLVALFRHALPPSIAVEPADHTPDDVAAHCPVMSLPYVLGLGGSVAGDGVPYLAAPGPCPAAIAEAIPETSALRVGFVWAGQPKHLNDRNRSMPLERLAPLIDHPGVHPYAVQKGPGEAALAEWNAARLRDGRPAVPALAPLFTDFTDTAHALTRLDLVITVDTSVAHLAGAMGRPVWLLIPFVPDWRWQLHREDSPWYPSVRIFRQPARGAWEPVIDAVRRALDALIAGRTGA